MELKKLDKIIIIIIKKNQLIYIDTQIQIKKGFIILYYNITLIVSIKKSIIITN